MGLPILMRDIQLRIFSEKFIYLKDINIGEAKRKVLIEYK